MHRVQVLIFLGYLCVPEKHVFVVTIFLLDLKHTIGVLDFKFYNNVMKFNTMIKYVQAHVFCVTCPSKTSTSFTGVTIIIDFIK